MREGGAEGLVSTAHLPLTHQKKSELVFTSGKQGLVVLQAVQGQRFVREFDCPIEVTPFLVRNAQSVVSPAQPGQVPNSACRLQSLFVVIDRLVVTVVLDVNRGDVLQDSRLCAGQPRLS